MMHPKYLPLPHDSYSATRWNRDSRLAKHSAEETVDSLVL